jgi:hypothetical protein
MVTYLSRLFLTHPRAVDESYVEHFFFALWFAGQLAMAAGAALCHAVLPFTCERTASTIVARLYARTHNRGR